MNKNFLEFEMKIYALSVFGREFDDLTNEEKFYCLSKSLMEEISEKMNDTEKKFEGKRKAYYFSAEFLMGRALSNNLINLGYKKEVKDILEKLGTDYNSIEESESDAGLGNGGLGRLAACFLDSAATHDYSLTGYGIRYRYGIFDQELENGYQVEKADEWLKHGDPFSVKREDLKVKVNFRDQSVYAVPVDMPIVGYGGKTVNILRLWESKAITEFDFEAFNEQDYVKAVQEKIDAENISKVLYPNDSNEKGRILRLRQQYFFVSASLQDLVRKFKETNSDFNDFPKYHAIQLNDTHPAVAIPELIRLLKIEGINFEDAFNIAQKTFAYTNHTILKEALEQWPVHIFKDLLPDVYHIIERINDKLSKELDSKGVVGENKREYLIIEGGSIKMAWLAIYGSYSTNGVARLHSNILKASELNNWYRLYPERFNNKTNGITQRRWLLKANPELSEFITKLLGHDRWITNLDYLKDLEKFADDDEIIKEFIEIKKIKKSQLKEYILEKEGIEIDENSIFDIQIKRLHEYKRQLLNAFHVLYLYNKLKTDKDFDMAPQTFIFGAKAAPGYYRAKSIIKLINDVKEKVNNDDETNDKLKVVFATNYGVSYGELLFPAADISEQISTAGKEASGTGNMKFMLNGAPTIGTLDGANIEIVEEAGSENNYIFGLEVSDIKNIENSYNPKQVYENNHDLKKVIDSLVDGTFGEETRDEFRQIFDSLVNGGSWNRADEYYVLEDFEDYRKTQAELNEDFKNPIKFYRKAFLNMVNAGKFSSDRTIEEYAKEIWKIKKY
ncbi:MAG: glycogen/starch/alpha-glucan phosphorylase [Clostridium sp.]|nr:glycogen/starch/alpha-glucan phosphorylase [Clostridium sp.]